MKGVTLIFVLCIFTTALSQTAWKLPQDEKDMPRIVGGVPASPKYRKGTVLIMYEEDGDYFGWCTGSIIGRGWVLSAAHCFEADDGSIFGDGSRRWGVIPSTKWATAREGESAGIFASQIWIHKKYQGGDMRYDVAVFELESDIPNSRYKKVTISKPPRDNTKVKAVGYGALNEDGEQARRCMMVNVVYRKFNWCLRNEESDGAYSKSQQICAVSIDFPEGKTDTCYGDSGGPLYKIRRDNKLFQIGITSFSNSGCAEPFGIPWYVRAQKYKRAIKKLMNGRSGPFYSVPGDLTRRR